MLGEFKVFLHNRLRLPIVILPQRWSSERVTRRKQDELGSGTREDLQRR